MDISNPNDFVMEGSNDRELMEKNDMDLGKQSQ